MEHACCENCEHHYCASKVPIFTALSPEELEQVVSMTGHREFTKGDMVFLEGQKASSLYIINEGEIKLFKYTREGKEQILHILSEGDFFGELALFKEEELTFNAEAITPVKLCTLSKKDMQGILVGKPEIAIKILQIMGERLSKLEKLIQNLATQDIEARIAALLMELKEKHGTHTKKGVEIHLPLTREEMANYIGVTRETMSRKLGSLQDQGVIRLVGNKRIIILDEALLKEYL